MRSLPLMQVRLRLVARLGAGVSDSGAAVLLAARSDGRPAIHAQHRSMLSPGPRTLVGRGEFAAGLLTANFNLSGDCRSRWLRRANY